MAGIRMKLKSIGAPVLDTFAAAGTLEGSATTYGSKTWTKVGTGDTAVSKSGGVVRATSGTTNSLLVLDTGTHNFDAGMKISKLRAPTSITALIVRAGSDTTYFSLSLRLDGSNPAYTLLKRNGGTNTQLIATGVAPKEGDMVLLSIRNHVATVIVNGVSLGSATLDAYGSNYNAGLLFNGTDTTTEIHDFAVYPVL
ncbi:hypothetical protein [Glutamicibacter sp.]|uniref:hypothetical protein n=1 Tax=Glutamicibacter sp. TaxID=1931995 RepID=UPI003D6C1606